MSDHDLTEAEARSILLDALYVVRGIRSELEVLMERQRLIERARAIRNGKAGGHGGVDSSTSRRR
jgi:hypothetical protein